MVGFMAVDFKMKFTDSPSHAANTCDVESPFSVGLNDAPEKGLSTTHVLLKVISPLDSVVLQKKDFKQHMCC
jgi:hypothetical protein